jgi:hypothetical protein
MIEFGDQYVNEAVTRVLARNEAQVTHNCINVPEMKPSKGLKSLTADNRELLKDYGIILRHAQTLLDRIPTGSIEEILGKDASTEEVMEFKAIEALNSTAVTAILKMRRLATAILVKAGR